MYLDDEFCENSIRKHLEYDTDIIFFSETDSTNEEIKRRCRDYYRRAIDINNGACPLVIVSDSQTGGKGRRGRSFFSPPGSGIYLSMLFIPELLKASDSEMISKGSDVGTGRDVDSVLITTQAAVAVASAISEVCCRETSIKWVNDVYLNDKKICGILTEAISEPGSAHIDMIVVGIGINVYRPVSMPDELEGIMGHIYDAAADGQDIRGKLCAAVIDKLVRYYEALPDTAFLAEYKKRSNVIGQDIMFGTPGSIAGEVGDDWSYGRAVDIDDTGGLVVRLPDGSTQILHTGEITLRTRQ
ncbi:MAG: biotin--[acetyl-CoA-carboxylase] ligase [Eubacterium sp.]|nr:biotin--[acetyl-CoA-carboxylase] ligase [Eubacterium sp.]